MSINSEIFESNGEQFTRSDYNGVNIIIRNKDGYINATKIANDNGKRKRLPEYLKSDKWKEICEAYNNEAIKNILTENSVRTKNGEFSYELTNKTDPGHKREVYGTYVDPKLVHFVAEWCNISYAFKVATIMDNIDRIKTLRKTSGNYNLTQTIEKQCSEIKFLQGEVETKDKKIEELFKQIDELLAINKKQTKKLDRLTETSEDMRARLISMSGRVSGKEVKDSKILMMYTVKDEHNDMFIKIVRAQPTSLRGLSKEIYDKEAYLFLSNLPEAINQNKAVLNKLLSKVYYDGYITTTDRGNTTKLHIHKNEYFSDSYGDQYKTFSQEKKTRMIHRFIRQFATDYKRELAKQITINVKQDDED